MQTSPRPDFRHRESARWYGVTLIFNGAPNPHDDTLADALHGFHATISEHPRGTTEVCMALPAETGSHARRLAVALTSRAGMPNPIGVEVSTTSISALGTGRARISPREARAAARAKVTIDRQRGRTTPKWVRELANRDRSRGRFTS